MMGESPADAFAKAVIDPEHLTDAELVVMDAWMAREMSYWARVKQLADAGVYPAEIWQQHRTEADYALASKFGLDMVDSFERPVCAKRRGFRVTDRRR